MGSYNEIINGIKNKYANVIDMDNSTGNAIRIELSNLLRNRNKQLASFLQTNGIEIGKIFDISGGIKFPIELLEAKGTPENLKNYFNSGGNSKLEGNHIFSRGRKYYFDYNGISINSWGLNDKKMQITAINGGDYIKNINEHLQQIHNLVLSCESNNISPIIILSLLDQQKNILLFYLNFLTILSDKDLLQGNSENGIFTEQELAFLQKTEPLKYSNINNQIINIDFQKLISKISTTIEYIIYIICEVILFKRLPAQGMIERLSIDTTDANKLFSSFFEFLSDACNKSKSGYGNNLLNKTSKKIIRSYREEDNIVNMLMTGFSIANLISGKKIKELNIYGILYGGAEMPFILAYILEKLSIYTNPTIKIQAFPVYDLKNFSQGKRLEEYPSIKKTAYQITQKTLSRIDGILSGTHLGNNGQKKGRKTYHIILDDNITTGRTINEFGELVKNEYPQDNIIITATAGVNLFVGERFHPDIKNTVFNHMPFAAYRLPRSPKTRKNRITLNINKYMQSSYDK